MPRVSGPLFSAEATGTLANLITYYRRPGARIARVFKKPTNPRTQAQRQYRRLYAQAVAAWQQLYPALKDQWRAIATPPRSGYNEYVREYLLQGGPPNLP